MATSRVGILIPAYNEEGTIADVVSGASRFGQVFVSDDGSTDATADVARGHGAVVISQGGNHGYDSALAFGLSTISPENFDFVVTMDADGQHHFRDISAFVSLLSAGADVVVGKRPQKARLMEKIFGMFTNRLWGVADPLCGMKGYRTSLLGTERMGKTYNSVGTEVLMFALIKGLRVVSVPISVRDRDGKPRFSGLLKANLIIGIAFAAALVTTLRSLLVGFLSPRVK